MVNFFLHLGILAKKKKEFDKEITRSNKHSHTSNKVDMVTLLSKIDANLLQFAKTKKESIDLYLPDPTNNVIDEDINDNNDEKAISINSSSYSGSIQTSTHDIISYHVSSKYNLITLYQLTGSNVLKTVNIHLYTRLLNKHHTLSSLLHENEEILIINMILDDNVFISINLPLSIFAPATRANELNLNKNWFTAHAPYDFTVRVPHYLYTINSEFSMIFLEDGGLLGLKSLHDKSFEPILFNDESYLQSLFGMFKKNKTHGKVVSCIIFQDRFLITLTEFAYLRIWDLKTFNLVQNIYLLPNDPGSINKTYDIIGNYLTIYHNFLTIYLPYENGKFELCTLFMDNSDCLQVNIQASIPCNLASSSIWFLADMKLTRPLDLNLPQSFINLIVLWKSGDNSKLQLLNVTDETLTDYQWIESSNKSINDIDSNQDLVFENNIISNDDFEKMLFNLKHRYSEDIFERAQSILNENNIIIRPNNEDSETNMKQKFEYLGNLETILRDLKKQAGDVSSLSLYKNEIIIVNSLNKYNHFVFKANDNIENYFYNITNKMGKSDSELIKFLKSLYVFTTSISDGTLLACARKFIEIVNGTIPKDLSLSEKFSIIFKDTLQSKFDINQLQILFNELNNLDIVNVMKDFIDNHILKTNGSKNFIEVLVSNLLTDILSIESLYQKISITNKFVLMVLLVFVLLDSNYSIFEKQLNTLLETFYKQSLFLKLYQQNDYLLIKHILQKTTELGNGIKFDSYIEWNNYIQHAVQQIYSLPIESNDYLWKFFEHYVVISPLDKSRQDLKIFSINLRSLFFIKGNKIHEFLQAMLLFVCGDYDKSFEFFQLHDDYLAIPRTSLPYFLNYIIDDEYGENLWSNIVKCFISKDHKLARFNYYLSCLFETYTNDNKLALRAIQKSIDISMHDEVHDIKDFDIATVQHQQLLNLLLHFSMYEEAIDVLRLSHFCLPVPERTKYFHEMLDYGSHNAIFFSKLLTLCKTNNQDEAEGKFLSYEDYHIIDSILLNNSEVTKDWKDYKRLYSFRLLNKFEREAAEIIYQYYIKHAIHQDVEIQKKCHLIVMNILETFDTVYDQWLLNGNDIISLQDLRNDFKRL